MAGPTLVLRLIEPEDADYLHGLRTNPVYNTHLSAVYGTADDQRQWINDYKRREAEGLEFYYLIERLDGVPCGTVRLYDIGDDHFTWGSWILDHNKTRKAALESAVLSFGIGFERLNRSRALVDVRVANEKAQSFYRRLGMTEIRRDARDIYFVYERAQFARDQAALLLITEGGNLT